MDVSICIDAKIISRKKLTGRPGHVNMDYLGHSTLSYPTESAQYTIPQAARRREKRWRRLKR